MNPTEAKTIEAKSTVVSRSIARTELPTAGQAVGTKKEADLSPAVVSEASAPPAVQSSPMPRDPFDPDIFNRQAHPQK